MIKWSSKCSNIIYMQRMVISEIRVFMSTVKHMVVSLPLEMKGGKRGFKDCLCSNRQMMTKEQLLKSQTFASDLHQSLHRCQHHFNPTSKVLHLCSEKEERCHKKFQTVDRMTILRLTLKTSKLSKATWMVKETADLLLKWQLLMSWARSRRCRTKFR